MKVWIVTENNGRVWSVHSSEDAADAERRRAIAVDVIYLFIEEQEVDRAITAARGGGDS